MRVAGIDCGTNSIRLLIADAVETDSGVKLSDVFRTMRIVRLGQDVDATGGFAPEALERTFAAVREYKALCDEHAVQQIRFAATSAARDASNRDVFLSTVTDLLGVTPEVITGDEEANLSFTGAASVRAGKDGKVLVIDLGGGSTEFVLGDGSGMLAATSLDMGCVRVTERFAQRRDAVEFIDQTLATLDNRVDVSEVDAVIVVAGTFTTLTAQALGLTAYDSAAIHGAELSFSDMRRATTQMLSYNREERQALGFMHPGRVDVIQAGAIIVERILDYLERTSAQRPMTLIASEHDILDGIAASAASN
ncbi:Ppx/GppA phosphatase family protein [Arthrobacter sp. MYb213]|uniref:Ppx/GppA phosphatase family protein n=1 Tax=Arthrobacter sp. MYb213 TaxID=1848595 RepID=UPI000CFC82BC|nr:Ppx/GppA phosphatase family protein [Arthrobacter sp. MYb213]PRB68704.1 exopolyphosphatase [Arthrobacter sp. MYb213]